MTRWMVPVLMLAACGNGVPEAPTYFADVAPILRANCVRCHGADPIDPNNPKLARFRLDRYVKLDDDPSGLEDVWDKAKDGEASAIMELAVHRAGTAMPPDYALTDRQRDILARWIGDGAPKGMEARENRLPEITLLAPTEVTTADQTLDVRFRAWDADLDGLVVQLFAHDLTTPAAQDAPLGDAVGGGERALTIDAGALASKHRFEIYAELDDGYFDTPVENKHRVTLIPDLAVDHGARGTAPTVTLNTPNGGEALPGSAQITWTATDPDAGDTLIIDLALVSVAADGTETVAEPIASGLPNTGSFTWTIPSSVPATDGAGKEIPYKVRVTATDTLGMPPNTRSDSSDATLSIAHVGTTTLTWADIKPILVKNCLPCHGQPAKTVALEPFRLDKYDAADPDYPGDPDLGVYEKKDRVYYRMVSARTMPPAAASQQPTATEIAQVGEWILAGAPYGSGPSDPAPTFTWVQPSATQTGSATVMLQWEAADAEGLMSGTLEYARANGLPSTGCTNLLNPTWTPIADPKASAALMGATSWADSFAWTLPTATTGYFCVRGTVTDSSNQTTTVVNPFGIK